MEFHIKHLTRTLIFFLPFLCLYCQNHSLTKSLSIDLPLPPLPLIPDILIFLDLRLQIVYPIIQLFKNTITSDPLGVTSTWEGSDICKYKGFYCGTPPNNLSATALASIDFNGYGIAAPTLDGFVDKLPDLALFHANTNKFSGAIPPKLAELPFLYELDLSNNKFSGTFPTSILSMTGLVFLDLRYNFFSGPIPPQLFTLNLELLFLNNNQFSLDLPENFGSTSAKYISLANNKFTGPIPSSIGHASGTLIEVLFLNNMLSGCLPYEIGFLSGATVFDASNNRLTGPLPPSLGCMKKMEQLNFAGNQLYGEVPEVLCALGNLVTLSLSDNYFNKVGPLCMKLIKSRVLDMRGNCVPGLPDQRSAAECTAFFAVQRSCPRESTYSTMPCSSTVTGKSKTQPARAAPPRNSVAYGSLVRHRRLL